jgi:hydroxyquinol 1,2-dioxygenase
MRDFDEHNITDAVLEKVLQSDDLRVRQISEALVRHLHAFVREIEPTQAEWVSAIDFLTRTGQMCSETRQEFILLSDTLGVSMLVDAINHRLPGGATETTVLGPFYVEAAPEHTLGDDISADMRGEPLLVEGTVSRVDGTPIAGAVVDTWHADGDGFYDVQQQTGLEGLAGRSRFRTDAQGRFWYRSVVPAYYPIPDDGPVGDMLKLQGRHPFRPAHVHFMVGAPGCETLITHIFLAGDKYLDSDVVFGVKDSLIKPLEDQSAGKTARGNVVDRPMKALRYDFVLADELAAPRHDAARPTNTTIAQHQN